VDVALAVLEHLYTQSKHEQNRRDSLSLLTSSRRRLKGFSSSSEIRLTAPAKQHNETTPILLHITLKHYGKRHF